MHPRVSNAEVQAVIRALMVGKSLPSGAAVRVALHARFGSRGGVTRIYQLLAEERAQLTPPPEAGSVEALQHELKAMRGRAERAEEREKVHQRRWAEEIDQLRLKVVALESFAQQARAARESSEFLRRQLQAAEQRASALEQQLYELARREAEDSALPSGTAEDQTVESASSI